MRLKDQLIDLPTLYHVIDRSPLTISPDRCVVEAIALMSQERSSNYRLNNLNSSCDSSVWSQQVSGCVLVVERSQLLGILTEEDVVKITNTHRDLSTVTIAEVMRQQVITLTQSDSQDIFTAWSLLRQHGIRYLPILDLKQQLVGIVSETTLLHAFDLVKVIGVVEGLQQYLQEPTDESKPTDQQIEEVCCQTHNYLKRLVEEESASVMQVNKELQRTLEELKVVEEELRLQNEELSAAREKVESQRQRYQDLFEFAPDGYLVTDTTGIIIEANHAAATLLCVQQKYLVGKPLILFIAQPDHPTFIAQLNSFQQTQDWEIYLQPRRGTPFPASISLAAVYDSRGRRVGWRWLLCDITVRKQAEEVLRRATEELEKHVAERTAELVVSNTLLQEEISERQRAEEALRQSEKLYRQLVESQTDMIIRIDMQGKITFANTAACQTLGWQLDELRGQSLSQFFHPDELPQAMQYVRAILSPPHCLNIREQRTLTVNGLRWFEWNLSAIKDETGEVFEVQGVGRDITERKQMEEALRESEEKFRHFAENTHALIWIGNPETGENLYVNPAYEKIWGRSCQSLRDQPNSWVDGVHPEDRDRLMAKLERQKRGEATSEEYRILQPDGSMRWIWDRGFAMQNEQGYVYSCGGVVEDITERKQAEESLRQSEARLSLALEAAHMGIWDCNLITNHTIWSDNMGPLHGLPSGTLCPNYEDYLNLIYPEDRKPREEALAQAIEEGSGCVDYRVVWPDGSLHWLNCKGQVYHDEIGQPIRMIGTSRDITDRKQAEKALIKSEERYRSVVTAMQEGVVLKAADDCRIIACNTSAERILGLTADEMIGRTPQDPCWQVICEDGSPFPSENYPSLVSLRTGKPCSNVVMGIYKPNGQLAWISINSQPLFQDNNPIPYAVVASFSDISDRKQAEQKIYEQAALLDIATDAILVRDFKSQILFWNKGAERLYGWQATEAVGKNPQELLYKKTSPELEIALTNVVEFGSWHGELNKVTKSGQEIIVESRWTLMRDAAGEPKSILSVDTDITEKKQHQAQSFRTQRLENLGTIAGGIAHDLNNILTPILAAAQLVQGRFAQDEERSKQLLALVESNANRGADLVKQVLSFTRGFKGEHTIVQPKHLISEITQIAQTFPKSIEFYTDIPQDLWTISGDFTQLHQVLMNLVVNARDAMPDGGSITISAQNKFIDDAYAKMNLEATVGPHIVITVADTGIGMPPEILNRIFEPFFTTKDVSKGTGLGLSTTLGIIKNHGGFVKVSSPGIGQGSQFRLFFPAVQATQTLSTDNLDMPQGQGELILVVDDEDQIRKIATIILENHNYKTLIASNGIEAIALYAQHKHKINTVLMDMMMPELDGITAIRTLQRMNPQVQIIACSGLHSTEFFTQATGPDIQAFLSKPYTARELLTSLHQILRG
ncbi:PAS domain S-box protein [Komarekiella sp. 'clone 1']|uniref:histidine kinase n=1 Tax=Komarekiella delphini-convector SJRDD-AB1 TaxID=2593771 RepID=A0AA40SW38_9NOST|nr:PAS domain S-box protein [Komarekiella delphini-convector]MBD6616391.1 PAS domain S-box protein [Komarekiella delphini-convector SJRDD-AB1]